MVALVQGLEGTQIARHDTGDQPGVVMRRRTATGVVAPAQHRALQASWDDYIPETAKKVQFHQAGKKSPPSGVRAEGGDGRQRTAFEGGGVGCTRHRRQCHALC